jgi:hypothetical protein
MIGFLLLDSDFWILASLFFFLRLKGARKH